MPLDGASALVAPDNTSVQVPGPLDLQARPIRGAGWVLNLKAGWTVQSSGRSGSFVVARER